MRHIFLLVGLVLVMLSNAQYSAQPEQVHIALGEAPGSMTISWVTQDRANDSLVEYGIGGLNFSVNGTQTAFTDGGGQKRVIYVHKALVSGLKAIATYTYHVGGAAGWSPLFKFKMLRSDPDWSPRVAVYGDFGNTNAQSLARIQQEVQRSRVDAVLHVGDIAYDLASHNGFTGDDFMRQIEPVAAYVPYMVSPGNHEYHYNFSNYKARFAMPKANGDGENLFYSFDLGRAHIVSFSTEVYYYLQFGFRQIERQLEWLKKDFKKANANRAERPWLITMGHRPAYCSNADRDDCSFVRSVIRLQLEDFFYQHGVDLMLWAHEHSYERLWPIYNYMVCNGTGDNVYDNPPAPVHIVTGSAGCQEKLDKFLPKPWWSAFRLRDYGYTHMTIHNATHLELNQVSDDKGGSVVDHIMYVRDKHGAGVFTCHAHSDPAQRKLLRRAQEEQQRRNWLFREATESQARQWDGDGPGSFFKHPDDH